ncbi:FG-GAP-like repeat-containing protein [Candidatus Aenigmatarchaeota archaeon]
MQYNNNFTRVATFILGTTLLIASTFGCATKRPYVSTQSTNRKPLCAAFGDIDGDGDTDKALGTVDNITLYRNDGTGNFTYHGELPIGTTDRAPDGTLYRRLSICFVDIDDDDDIDLHVVNRDGEATLFNDGKGNFSVPEKE